MCHALYTYLHLYFSQQFNEVNTIPLLHTRQLKHGDIDLQKATLLSSGRARNEFRLSNVLLPLCSHRERLQAL